MSGYCKILFVLLLCFAINRVDAQDIHYSQFEASPINLNPALTGNFNGDYRIVANNRNQWQSITVPYKTFSASFDAGFNSSYFSNSRLGAGLVINSDRAGDGNFGTTQIKGVGAFHKSLKDSLFILSFGVSINYNQHSVDFESFYFGSQYNGNSYDMSLSSGENYVNNNISYFDFELGAVATYNMLGYPLNFGVSFIHINQPKRTFYNEDAILLDRKCNVFLSSDIRINSKSSFKPSALYLNQGRFKEIDLGGEIKLDIENVNVKALYIGGWLRLNDAGFIKVGADIYNFQVGLSYDINTSKLREASFGRGGTEISLIYIFNKSKAFDTPKYNQCPSFL